VNWTKQGDPKGEEMSKTMFVISLIAAYVFGLATFLYIDQSFHRKNRPYFYSDRIIFCSDTNNGPAMRDALLGAIKSNLVFYGCPSTPTSLGPAYQGITGTHEHYYFDSDGFDSLINITAGTIDKTERSYLDLMVRIRPEPGKTSPSPIDKWEGASNIIGRAIEDMIFKPSTVDNLTKSLQPSLSTPTDVAIPSGSGAPDFSKLKPGMLLSEVRDILGTDGKPRPNPMPGEALYDFDYDGRTVTVFTNTSKEPCVVTRAVIQIHGQSVKQAAEERDRKWSEWVEKHPVGVQSEKQTGE